MSDEIAKRSSAQAAPPEELVLTRPDDWHVHLRDGEILGRVLPFTAGVFGRAIVMPNLDPPVARVEQAEAYAKRIGDRLPPDSSFTPLMTLYLTDETTPAEVERAARHDQVFAIKLYPRGATTNSASGVVGLDAMAGVLEAMERFDLPLLVHGESTAPDCDVFDRERVFLEETLAPLVERHEGLRVVFEHITTADAARFVEQGPARVAATITPQHLLMNRNALFEGGLRPHRYCLPVLKREDDRRELLRVATSGHPSFFLGTDSAPHVKSAKESACGCAGIFSAPIALELYAEAFAEAGALNRLEGFASHHGADFYRLPRNRDTLRLTRSAWTGPSSLAPASTEDGEPIEVYWAGRSLRYRLADDA